MESFSPGNNRPYPPVSNVIDVLARLRSRNLPERVDNEYLRVAGVPKGTIGRTMFGLKFLGLVEDDQPSQALREIANATDEEYHEILAGLIKEHYREVFDFVDPAEDTQDRILNVFMRYSPASQRERMTIFFLGMCREAGMPVKDSPRQRGSSVQAGRTAPTTRRPTVTARTQEKPKRGDAGDGHRGADMGGDQSDLNAALQLLVRSLPPAGSVMSKEKRKHWLQMAQSTLEYVYPYELPAPESPDERAEDTGEDEVLNS